MGFRRASQLICLFVFLALLAGAGHIKEANLFLRMDPALTLITAIAGRMLPWLFFPALIVVLSAFFFGRLFCGYICPMGTTLDVAQRFIGKPHPKANPAVQRLSPLLNRYVLIFLIGAGLAGVSLVSWASPLALITRFYGLVIYPVIELAGDQGLVLIYPIASWLDMRTLMFAGLDPPRFATGLFVLALFALIFASGRITPRFWCRYLCPAGGFLAMAAKKPLFRRRVSEACNQCGICAQKCPMGAIDSRNPEITNHSACITCRTCETHCPAQAIEFRLQPKPNALAEKESRVKAGRRQFLLAGAAGVGAAAVSLSGLQTVAGKKSEGWVQSPRLIRPPGALPEPGFLAACVRCGECMSACPTNTLQPIWFEAGILGMFSPAVTPERKYCDPRCTVCGDVCPTRAIRAVSEQERVWARTGTAVIYRQKCLAWEHKKSCMVCDEVCPYDAVEFEKKPELPHPVPHVDENKCAGCGYCEHYCPVENKAAIVVTPMNELRLSTGSYKEAGKIRGYQLSLRPPSEPLEPRTYPGAEGGKTWSQEKSTENGAEGMAPGFDSGY